MVPPHQSYLELEPRTFTPPIFAKSRHSWPDWSLHAPFLLHHLNIFNPASLQKNSLLNYDSNQTSDSGDN